MRTQGNRGYTLIELLTTVSILSLLLLLSAPTFSKLINENRQQADTFTLFRLLTLARSHAVSYHRIITLCGSNDNIHCVKDWSSPTIIIFDDSNDNHIVDGDEKILRQEMMANSQWYWRGSDRAYLRFRADGTPKEWGHFTLCPTAKTIGHATQIILNFVGRPYSKDLPLDELASDESCS